MNDEVVEKEASKERKGETKGLYVGKRNAK
jgi:hypothetical protein